MNDRQRTPPTPARGLLALANAAMSLKAEPRTGWLDRGVNPDWVESVADHSFGVALLAWAGAMERRHAGAALDPTRVMMLALIHDLSEAATGDLPPYEAAAVPGEADPAARREFLNRRHVRGAANAAAKRANEDTAMTGFLETLSPATRAALIDLWEELQAGASREAQFVKQVDRLETFLQSRRYLDEEPSLPMDSFRQEVEETIDDPLLAAMRDASP